MKNLYKHLKRVTTKKGLKVFSGIIMEKNNNWLASTDSKRALTYKPNYNIPESMVIDPDTLQKLDCDLLPPLNNVIKIGTNSIELDINELIYKETVKTLTKNKKLIVKMNISEKGIDLTFDNGTQEYINSLPVLSHNLTNDYTILLNAEYLRDLLEFILDFKQENNNSIFLTFTDVIRPLLVTDHELFNYVIAPIKK